MLLLSQFQHDRVLIMSDRGALSGLDYVVGCQYLKERVQIVGLVSFRPLVITFLDGRFCLEFGR